MKSHLSYAVLHLAAHEEFPVLLTFNLADKSLMIK
jgi:hypothetical protein